MRLFPVLRRVAAVRRARRRSAPVPADPQELRRRGFAALRELLAQLARLRPVVVFVDDAHWGDADSAVFLAELIHGAEPGDARSSSRTAPRTTSASSRSCGARPAAARGAATSASSRSRALADDDAVALVAQLAADPSRAEAVVAAAAGNPLVLTEMARAPSLARGHDDRRPRARARRAAAAGRPGDARGVEHRGAAAAGRDRGARGRRRRRPRRGERSCRPSGSRRCARSNGADDPAPRARLRAHRGAREPRHRDQGRLARGARARVRGGAGRGRSSTRRPSSSTGSRPATRRTPRTTRSPRRSAPRRRSRSGAPPSSTRSRSRTGRGTPRASATCSRRKAHALGVRRPARRGGRRSTATPRSCSRCRGDRSRAAARRGAAPARPARRGAARRREAARADRHAHPARPRASRTRLATQWMQAKLRGLDYVERDADRDPAPASCSRSTCCTRSRAGSRSPIRRSGASCRRELMRAALDAGEPVRVCLALAQEVCYAAAGGQPQSRRRRGGRRSGCDAIATRLGAPARDRVRRHRDRHRRAHERALARRARPPRVRASRRCAITAPACAGRSTSARRTGSRRCSTSASGARWRGRRSCCCATRSIAATSSRSRACASAAATSRGSCSVAPTRRARSSRSPSATLGDGFHLPHVLGDDRGGEHRPLRRRRRERGARGSTTAWAADRADRRACACSSRGSSSRCCARGSLLADARGRATSGCARRARSPTSSIKEGAPWAAGLGHLIRAACARVGRRRDAARVELLAAEDAARRDRRWRGCVQIARLRRGRLEGGAARARARRGRAGFPEGPRCGRTQMRWPRTSCPGPGDVRSRLYVLCARSGWADPDRSGSSYPWSRQIAGMREAVSDIAQHIAVSHKVEIEDLDWELARKHRADRSRRSRASSTSPTSRARPSTTSSRSRSSRSRAIPSCSRSSRCGTTRSTSTRTRSRGCMEECGVQVETATERSTQDPRRRALQGQVRGLRAGHDREGRAARRSSRCGCSGARSRSA